MEVGTGDVIAYVSWTRGSHTPGNWCVLPETFIIPKIFLSKSLHFDSMLVFERQHVAVERDP